jgi:hypothetical protein
MLDYYGLDWAGMALTLFALWLLGNRRPSGFTYGMASNVAWGAFGVAAASVPTVAANVACFLLNLRGWMRWREAEALASPPRIPSAP